jgi:hypothetical protein
MHMSVGNAILYTAAFVMEMNRKVNETLKAGPRQRSARPPVANLTYLS